MILWQINLRLYRSPKQEATNERTLSKKNEIRKPPNSPFHSSLLPIDRAYASPSPFFNFHCPSHRQPYRRCTSTFSTELCTLLNIHTCRVSDNIFTAASSSNNNFTQQQIYDMDYATGKLAEDFVDAVANMQKTTSEHVLLGSSSDGEEGNVSGNQTQMGESAPPSKRAKREKTSKGKGSKEGDGIGSEEASFQYFMKEMNLHLSTMASAMSEANAREKEEADQKNKVLPELLALEGITPDQAYDVAEILTAEPHKLNLFFQSPDDMKPFFVKRVLRGKENRNA